MDDQSVFNKWRALIALANVDGKVTKEEREFLIEHLQKLDSKAVTAEQKKTLIEDFKEPKSPEVFIARIDNKVERLDFLRLAHFLFWSDGDFDVREQQAFKRLKESVSVSMNISEKDLDEITSLKGQKKTLREILTEQMTKKR